jgi:hypothetical protein
VDSLEKIAELLKTYYSPIQLIEHKYRSKVTAIGLLKGALFTAPEYLEPYYARLKSYKGLIRDHTDNMKLAENIAINIFSQNIKSLLENYKKTGQDDRTELLNRFISLIHRNCENASPERITPVRKSFVEKYTNDKHFFQLSVFIIRNYLDSSEKYDILADMIVKRCLSGITQEDVTKRSDSSQFNYFVYGIYSKVELTNIYNITVRVKGGNAKPLKYFTKLSVLARAIMNQVKDNSVTINFFGQLWEPYEEIKSLFGKNTNITILFY